MQTKYNLTRENSMGILSNKLSAVKPSQTKAMTEMAESMREAGKSIITLSQGEPDFDTPQHIREAAIDAIHAGHTRYTSVAGITPLREAIVEKFHRENNLTYTIDQITVGCGAKQLLFSAEFGSYHSIDNISSLSDVQVAKLQPNVELEYFMAKFKVNQEIVFV